MVINLSDGCVGRDDKSRNNLQKLKTIRDSTYISRHMKNMSNTCCLEAWGMAVGVDRLEIR